MANFRNSALVTLLTPFFKRRSESAKYNVYTTNVSNPPTDAELDSAFGPPASDQAGWSCIIDDNGLGSVWWLVVWTGSSWIYEQMSIAV